MPVVAAAEPARRGDLGEAGGPRRRESVADGGGPGRAVLRGEGEGPGAMWSGTGVGEPMRPRPQIGEAGPERPALLVAGDEPSEK